MVTIDDYLNELKTRTSLEGFLKTHDHVELMKNLNESGETSCQCDNDTRQYLLRKAKDAYENLRVQPNVDNILEYAESLALWKKTDLTETLCGIALAIAPKYLDAYHILARMHHDISCILDNEGKDEEAKRISKFSDDIAERALEYLDVSAAHLLDDVLDSADFLHDDQRFQEKGIMCYKSFSDKYMHKEPIPQELIDELFRTEE